jgi:hypothetical protein
MFRIMDRDLEATLFLTMSFSKMIKPLAMNVIARVLGVVLEALLIAEDEKEG